MKKLTAVGFDLDGTLIDSIDLSAKWLTISASKALGKPIAESLVRSHFGKPEPILLRDLLPGGQADLAFSFYQEIFLRECEQIKLYPRAREVLGYLREHNFSTSLFTSRGAWATAEILKKLELNKFFDFVLTGDEVKAVKPDPEGIVHLCGLSGVSPANFIFVGDSPDDIRAAENAGGRGYQATWA